eukprot:PhF_6_TR33727/c0_g1_i1/m.49532/K04986/PKD2; polycystin 2
MYPSDPPPFQQQQQPFLKKPMIDVPPEIMEKINHAATFQAPKIFLGVRFLITFMAFIGFVILLTFSVHQDRVISNSFTFTESIRHPFENDALKKVNSMEDANAYIQTVLMPAFINGFIRENSFYTSGNESLAFGGSILLSGIRFRQHRVDPTCDREAWRNKFGPCRPDGVTDSTFTSAPFRGTTGKLYEYTNEATLCGTFKTMCSSTTTGEAPAHTAFRTSLQYPAGGYIIDVTQAQVEKQLTSIVAGKSSRIITKEDIARISQDVTTFFQEGWIDANTRAILVEMALMNSNLPEAMFAAPQIVFEFPSEGGTYTSFLMSPFKLRMTPTYAEQMLVIVASFVGLFFLGNVGRTVLWPQPCVMCLTTEHEEVLSRKPWYECKRCKTGYDRETVETCPHCRLPMEEWNHICLLRGRLADPSMFLSIGNTVLLLVTFFLRQNVRTALQERLDTFESYNKGQLATLPFIDFAPMQKAMNQAFSLSSYNLILSYIGFYSYLRHFETIALFLRVFRYSFRMLYGFIMTAAVPFSAFAMTFYLLLGTRTEEYRGSVFSSMIATFRIMVNDLSFSAVQGDSEAVVEIFWVLYGIFVIMITMNVFIAIVGGGFDKAILNKHNHQVLQSLHLVKDRLLTQFNIKRGPQRNPSYGGKNQEQQLEELMELLQQIKRNR